MWENQSWKTHHEKLRARISLRRIFPDHFYISKQSRLVNVHKTGRSKEDDHFLLSSEIRGYHVFKKSWAPKTGDEEHAIPEFENPYDSYAVAFSSTKIGE